MRKNSVIAGLAMLVAVLVTGCSGAKSVEKETTAKTESVSEATTEMATEAATEKASVPSTKKSSSSTSSSFTNKYGTATTKCAHSGCNNTIASSGDTNCCTTHSKRCLECNKYIDEDAMYCMSCLTKAANSSKSSSSSGSSKSYSSKSSGSSNIGAGGYEMPNENDKSFSDYVKRVDPELYNSLFQ